MANTLFVFLSQTTSFKQAFSVVIGTDGQVTEPYQIRSLIDIKVLCKNNTLTIVLPSYLINSQMVKLPTLKNAQLMLPNILEESLIGAIESYHFVLNKTPVKKNQYLCHYIDKNILNDLLESLNQMGLSPNCITSDLLLNKQNSLFIGDSYLQIASLPNNGMLNETSFHAIDPLKLESCKNFSFTNSNQNLIQLIQQKEVTQIPLPYQAYIATQHVACSPFNLLQGAYEIKKKNSKIVKLLTLPLLTVAICFFSATNVLNYQKLSQSVQRLQQENFGYYQTVFPQAKQMISPRFRVEQWLKTHATKQLPSTLVLLQKTAPILQENSNINILSIHCQSDRMTLTFQVNNFSDLNSIKSIIEQKDIRVEQVNALTQNNAINAIWKLSL